VNEHLSETQIAAWALGEADESARRHLASCAACSRETESLRRTLAGFGAAVQTAAERDQKFWTGQRFAIQEKISALGWYPLHWAWVLAMVVVLTTAVFLTRNISPLRINASDDADRALLQEVQGDLTRDVPEALDPAVLIAEERDEILTSQSVPQTDTSPTTRRPEK
jgi:hypothetical protein